MLLAVFDNRSGDTAVNASNMSEQSSRSRIQLDARKVDAGDNHSLQHLGQGFLVNIVLIETNAQRAWIDLDQLRQRVLEATSDRNGTALRGVQRWEFLAGNLRGRIDRGSSLIDDHIADLAAATCLFLQLAYQCRHQLLRLTRGCAIAYGDDLQVVLANQAAQRLPGFLLLMEVDGIRGQVFAGLVDDGQLAASAIARVN